ncbi:MAG TPA: signal peptidase II [Neobacillus sp.]|jgi:signal peptidase II
MFYILALLVIVMDQLSKTLIRFNFNIGETLEVWDGVLNFTRYENSGASFSSFQGYGRLFVPIAAIIVVFVLYYRRKFKIKRFTMEMGSALLVGGAIGNAIDRVLFNQVTDFIEFQSGHGILNLADMAINVGIIFVLIDVLFFQRDKEKQ